MTGGLGTHTPISFGKALERSRDVHMRGFSLDETPGNERFLLYQLHRKLSAHWHGFIVVQGARRSGRFTAEVGIALHPRYPLHHARVYPFPGVDGVRERVAGVDNKPDFWWNYKSQAELEQRLREAFEKAARQGFNHLYEMHGTVLIREARRAQLLLEKWDLAEAECHARPLGDRFSGLSLEHRCVEFIRQMVHNPGTRAVLGDRLPLFADPLFHSAFVFVMASLLETSDVSEMSSEIKIPSFEDDEVISLCGRVPYYTYLDPSERPEERWHQAAFFKALDILDAQYAPENRMHLKQGERTPLRDDY